MHEHARQDQGYTFTCKCVQITPEQECISFWFDFPSDSFAPVMKTDNNEHISRSSMCVSTTTII